MTASPARRWRLAILGAPALFLLVVFFVLPYGEIVMMSFRTASSSAPYGDGLTLANYARMFADGHYLGILGETVLVGTSITAICLLISFPIALHLSSVGDRWHTLFYACVVSPLLVGVLVRNFGWMIILSFNGPINQILLALGLIERPVRLLFTVEVVVLALVHVFIPFMVLPITTALRNIPPSLYEASRSLGAGRFSTFWRVTLPLSFPGVQSGVILVFVLAISAYVTPVLLGGQFVVLMPTVIVQQLIAAFAWPFGAVLAMILTLSTLSCVLVFAFATRGLVRRAAIGRQS